jgi:hypothetical protein
VPNPKLRIGAPVKYTPISGDDISDIFQEATEIYVEGVSLLDDDTMLFSCRMPDGTWKMGEVGVVGNFMLLAL